MRNIVAICENEDCINALNEAGNKIGCHIDAEIQTNNSIINKVSQESIKNADAVLFALNCTIEEVEEIERFIDCEYYEVEPDMVIKSSEIVLKEIEMDLN